MKKKKDSKIWIIVFTLLILTLMVIKGKTITLNSASLETKFHVDPAETIVEVGQNFSVGIDISNVIDLYGWEFKLGYNSTFLEVLNVTEENFLRSFGDTLFVVDINNTEGYVRVACTLIGNIPGVSGNGTLATVEFYVETQGDSVLDLYDTKLVSSTEQPIEHVAIDGSVMVTYHDVAVTAITVSPITVVVGEPVQINVTVVNQGSFAENFNVSVYYDWEIIETKSTFLYPENSAYLTFIWNTTGVAKGDYLISAEAHILEDCNIVDNTRTAGGVVTVLYPEHDVAVVAVEPSKTVVGKGCPLSISVTVKNYGIFSESFNISTYVNTTFIGRTEITLASGDSATVVFMWNSSGFTYGNVSLSAYADPVPDETDTTDNAYTDCIVTVTIRGDVDGDRNVDIFDIVRMAGVYGEKQPDAGYDPNCDIDGDGDIDIFDIVTAAGNYGEGW